ncbi:hypothetical protein L1987_52253 [Smallanthus sonchifolius]|uniref:Uncharacterized protein n=1 Tax=Smallanthus sonchifolius TaxID=185202 RepID=A0ACB9ETQ8_9ASTR|nr:hypothetical protein L1987_52253 [Smallanthus sonchifolius]
MVIQVNRTGSSDQNDITKAAAWAWYERGLWFEQKAIRESDRIRLQDYAPRPSRYKIEAMKESQKQTHVDNSLMDMYEIERISRELYCYVESSRVDRHTRSVNGGDHGGRSTFSKETKGKRTGKKQSWGWRRHGIVCGSTEDVVEHTLLVGGRRGKKMDVFDGRS